MWVWLSILALVAGTTTPLQSLPSLAELESILDRSVTVLGAFTGQGAPWSPGFDDNLQFLRRIGAKYAGRAVYMWGTESQLTSILPVFAANAQTAHAALPDLVVEGCVFEIVTHQVEGLPIPPEVFAAFGLPSESRNFSYQKMLFPDGSFVNQWGPGASVPDFVQTETKLWFYFVATNYIQRGAEAIHFGQVMLMASQDPDRGHTWTMLSAVRNFAAQHARRGFVLCNAHVFQEGWNYKGTLLMDMHAFPSRPRDDVPHPQNAYYDLPCDDHCAPYRRSAGGMTVSGYQVDSLPFLVELDNWGESSTPGQHVPNSIWVWGWDEITWFAHQPNSSRSAYLKYAFSWLRDQDPRGHFEMPGLRVLSDGPWYYANAGQWRDDADAIANIWATSSRPNNTLRAGDSLTLGSGRASQFGNFVLVLQLDGNLVEYDTQSGKAVWSAYTAPTGDHLDMQWDGNLVVYDKAGAPVWHTNTSGYPGAYLLLQSDGNLVVYWKDDQPVWNRESSQKRDN